MGCDLRLGLIVHACLSQVAPGLVPAEALFDSFALSLADQMVFGVGGAAIEARRLAPFNKCGVRLDPVLARVRLEVLDVVSLVGAQRFGMDAHSGRARVSNWCAARCSASVASVRSGSMRRLLRLSTRAY